MGAQKRRALLNFFGGLQGLETAPIETIANVPGIGPTLAEKIYRALHAD